MATSSTALFPQNIQLEDCRAAIKEYGDNCCCISALAHSLMSYFRCPEFVEKHEEDFIVFNYQYCSKYAVAFATRLTPLSGERFLIQALPLMTEPSFCI
jgi:hypothetical protein